MAASHRLANFGAGLLQLRATERQQYSAYCRAHSGGLIVAVVATFVVFLGIPALLALIDCATSGSFRDNFMSWLKRIAAVASLFQ